MIEAEQRGGIRNRVIKAGADIFTRTGSPETRKSIWERYPELRKIPEDRWPRNVFIIPDGNGRWAAAKKLAVQAGHERGTNVIVEAFRDFSELSGHIPYVGAWGLSVDNLNRPAEEVDFLMNLFDRTVRRLQPDLQKRGNRFIHIGRKDIFENHPQVGETIEEVEKETRGNTGQTIYIAIGFSGEDQELRVTQKIAEQVRNNPDIHVTKELIDRFKDGEGSISSADLIIRTSGEERLSDVGWIAGKGTELYFTRKLFPNFGTGDFVKALVNFSKRERRFGERPEKDK